jgi:hypothetical protein
MYVVGYGVKSEVKQRKGCVSCRELMLLERTEGTQEVKALPLITTEEVLTENAYEFVEEVNRGGLRLPTPAAFCMGQKAWLVFEVIDKSPLIEAKFWQKDCGGSNKKRAFACIVKSLLEKDGVEGALEEERMAVTQLECSYGHDICSGLAARLFSCMSKNMLKRINAAAKAEAEAKRNDRLKAKLQSSKPS